MEVIFLNHLGIISNLSAYQQIKSKIKVNYLKKKISKEMDLMLYTLGLLM